MPALYSTVCEEVRANNTPTLVFILYVPGDQTLLERCQKLHAEFWEKATINETLNCIQLTQEFTPPTGIPEKQLAQTKISFNRSQRDVARVSLRDALNTQTYNNLLQAYAERMPASHSSSSSFNLEPKAGPAL